MPCFLAYNRSSTDLYTQNTRNEFNSSWNRRRSGEGHIACWESWESNEVINLSQNVIWPWPKEQITKQEKKKAWTAKRVMVKGKWGGGQQQKQCLWDWYSELVPIERMLVAIWANANQGLARAILVVKKSSSILFYLFSPPSLFSLLSLWLLYLFLLQHFILASISESSLV